MTLNFAVPESATNSPLELALSPKAMLGAFQRYLPPRDGGEWVRCHLKEVRYHSGKSTQILYKLENSIAPSAGPPSLFFAEFLSPAEALQRFLELRRQNASTAPSGFVAELNMIYWRFPADPLLSQLTSVYQEGDWQVVSYRPTISCVLSGNHNGEKTILKLYRDDRASRVGRVIQALQDAGVAVPRLLHVDQSRRLVASEFIPGDMFWDYQRKSLGREVMGAMARELAILHETRVPEEIQELLPKVDFVGREWTHLQQVIPELVEGFPDLKERFERLLKMLEPRGLQAETLLVHGDFHPSQFLIHHGTPRLIDYDTVCFGDPMYDLARFASSLYSKGYIKKQDSRDIEKAISSFRSAYIAAGAVHFNAAQWFWHLSTALVARRAHRVMTRCEADAERIVTHLLTLAEQNAVSIVGS